jgi:hypothetical protein
MTYDSKLDALNVATNIHIALKLLQRGSNREECTPVVYPRGDGGFDVSNRFRYVTTLASNPWHRALQTRWPLHPAIDKLIQDYRPHDWQLLVMEYPHQSDTDRNRIAYTQSVRKGEADLQTVTSLGKYIRRHFPQVEDHVIRDAVAAYSVTGCKVVYTMAEMIYHLQRGPESCMRKADWNIDDHPYQAYCPTLGWGMAVREEGGDTVGRALVNERSKTYVRTYLKRDSFSHSDHELEAWLQQQGYGKASDWEGLQLKYVERRGSFLAPYIDGDIKDVDVTWHDGVQVLDIVEGGAYRCDQTGGQATDNDGDECEDCGERCATDDGYWVGRSEDRFVCDNCCDNNWTYAYSRNGYQKYISSDDTAYVNGEYYDTDYLSDNNIVELDCGDYEHIDNAVYVESADAYYHCDDEAICYDDYNNQYEMRDDCVCLEDGSMCHQDSAWQCEHTKEWYSDDVEYVEISGEKFHPDVAPEIEETTKGE